MPNNGANLPLAINMIGPMAFKDTGKFLEVWFPKLETAGFEHQAGIGSNVDSMPLMLRGEYMLQGPTPSDKIDYYFPTIENKASKIYELQDYVINDFFIHAKLPRPARIVGLRPVSCKIKNDDGEDKDWIYRSTGFRLLYTATNHPTIVDPVGLSSDIVIDVTDSEAQVEMFFSYAPYVYDVSRDHKEAKDDFGNLAAMCSKPNYKIRFEDEGNAELMNGALHDCVTVNVLLT